MTFREALALVEQGCAIKRIGWYDYLTVQTCNCVREFKRPHAKGGCPEPCLRFPDYTDPKLTVEDYVALDWMGAK